MLTLLVSPFVKLHNLADSQQTGQRIVKDINSVHNPFTLHQLGTLIAVTATVSHASRLLRLSSSPKAQAYIS
jgi:hypothetical protein